MPNDFIFEENKKFIFCNLMQNKHLESNVNIFLKKREVFWPFLSLSNRKTRNVNSGTGLNCLKIIGCAKG